MYILVGPDDMLWLKGLFQESAYPFLFFLQNTREKLNYEKLTMFEKNIFIVITLVIKISW